MIGTSGVLPTTARLRRHARSGSRVRPGGSAARGCPSSAVNHPWVPSGMTGGEVVAGLVRADVETVTTPDVPRPETAEPPSASGRRGPTRCPRGDTLHTHTVHAGSVMVARRREPWEVPAGGAPPTALGGASLAACVKRRRDRVLRPATGSCRGEAARKTCRRMGTSPRRDQPCPKKWALSSRRRIETGCDPVGAVRQIHRCPRSRRHVAAGRALRLGPGGGESSTRWVASTTSARRSAACPTDCPRKVVTHSVRRPVRPQSGRWWPGPLHRVPAGRPDTIQSRLRDPAPGGRRRPCAARSPPAGAARAS
jgi:hypothetical protein